MNTTSVRTSILIVTKNKPEFIRHCLDSLEADLENDEILVGDTGSTHSEVFEIYEEAKKKFGSKIKIYYLGFYHFSKNNNELAKHARGQILIFLNNDTVAFPGWLSKFVAGFKSYPDAGIIGPKLLYGNTEHIQHAGVELFRKGFYKFLPYHPYRGRHQALPEANKAKWIPAVTGACLAIPSALFHSVSGFNEEYQIEAQDIDLCLKVWKQGKKCLYLPSIQLYHLESGTRKTQKEALSDQNLFKKTWSKFINDSFFQRKYQSVSVDIPAPSYCVLFKSAGSREQILSCYQIVQEYKQKHPDHHVSFSTKYTHILDSFSEIDRVIERQAIDEDEFIYDKVIDLNHIKIPPNKTSSYLKMNEQDFAHFLKKNSGLFLGNTKCLAPQFNHNDIKPGHYFEISNFNSSCGLDFLCLDEMNFTLLNKKDGNHSSDFCVRNNGVLFLILDEMLSSKPQNEQLRLFHILIAKDEFEYLFQFPCRDKFVYSFKFSHRNKDTSNSLWRNVSSKLNKVPKIKRALKWVLLKILP